MQGVLVVSINDWTEEKLPTIRRGTILTIEKLEYLDGITMKSEYLAVFKYKGSVYRFEVSKQELDLIN